MIADFLNIIFSGLAYGVLLFLMASGLSVTMGLMRFANLAHGAFAMLGAYLAVTLMNSRGWPFLWAVPVAAVAAALVAAVFERLLFRRFYARSELDQVVLTVGLLLMAVAAATFVWGPNTQPVRMPPYLVGQVQLGFLNLDRYRIFLILAGGSVVLALIAGIERTSFGAKVRAVVDNARVAASCGIDVNRLFMITFFIGSGLAGLGGALSVNLIGLDPQFALNIIASVLIVVVVGGEGSMRGTLVAALLLGMVDVLGKYYAPQLGEFTVYGVMIALLLWRPRGLVPVR